MKKQSTSNELTELIKRLSVIRKEHVAALTEIEQTAQAFGIEKLLKVPGAKQYKDWRKTPIINAAALAAHAKQGAAKSAGGKKGKAAAGKKAAAAKKPTKAAKSKKGSKAAKGEGKRVRGVFEITGDELILRFVKKQGTASTEEIRKYWESQGRRGKSENNLTGLVRTGQLIRTRVPGENKSNYSVKE